MKKFFAIITIAAFLFLSGCAMLPKPIGMDSCDRVSLPTSRSKTGECIPHVCETSMLPDKKGKLIPYKNVGEFKHPEKNLWFIFYDSTGDESAEVALAYEILPNGKWKTVKATSVQVGAYIATVLQMKYHPGKEIVTFCPESKKKNYENYEKQELERRKKREGI